MDPNKQMLEEALRLARDNNHMLHAMRRHAFWGGIFKFIFWTAILVAPIWFYMTYLNATVEKMLHTIDQMQGTSAKAQTQLGNFEQMWKDLEAKLPAFMRASTSTTTQ